MKFEEKKNSIVFLNYLVNTIIPNGVQEGKKMIGLVGLGPQSQG
jgi:hypothetical protein